MEERTTRNKCPTGPGAVWLQTPAERFASPVNAAVRSDSEALLAERLASVWIRLQDKLEAQCSELCTSAKIRDDDLIKRLDECLSKQTSSWQESARNLDSLMASQQAQWRSIAEELTHLASKREPSTGSSEPTLSARGAWPPLHPATPPAAKPEPPEHPLNGSQRDHLVARSTWQEVPPPVPPPPSLEQPTAIPGSLPEEAQDAGNGRLRQSVNSRKSRASISTFQTTDDENESEDEDMDEQKLYEQAVAKAERMLMLRACALSRIEPERKPWREKLKAYLESWWAEGLCAFVIFTNCIIIGVETDVVAQAGSEKSPEVFSALDSFYTLVFFAELLVRLGAYGGSFFCGSAGLFWNYLDMMIVCPSMVQLAVRVIWQSDVEYGGSMTVVRVLRITRVFRVIRVVKVMKFVRSLRQLVESIMHTMKSLAWSMLLLVAIIYVFAIMFTDASVAYLVDNPSSPMMSELTGSWGTLHASMHTLFRAVSGGFDWGGTAAALGDIHVAWMYLFSAYIAFCMFAVLNVMTGIFCQVAVDSSRNDPQFLMQHLVAEKERQTDLIRNLFRIFDREKRGYIALTELEDKFNDETAQGMMGLLQIYPESGWSLFKKLDENRDGRLHEDEFVNGIFKLKGVAKSWDVEEILRGQKKLNRAIESQLRSSHARASKNKMVD